MKASSLALVIGFCAASVCARAQAPALGQNLVAAQTMHAGFAEFNNLWVSASGAGPLTYQWRKNGTIIASNGSGEVYNWGGRALTTADAGTYSVVVSNAQGSASSRDCVVTIASPLSPPGFSLHPASTTTAPGGTVSFSVLGIASQGLPLVYQWYKNYVPIAGATGTSLTISQAGSADAGTYYATVDYSPAAVPSPSPWAYASSLATLVISSPTVTPVAPPLVTTPGSISSTAATSLPVISAHPGSATRLSGQSVTFGVTAAGNPAPTYQWRKNGVTISGARSATYTVAQVQASDAGTYSVVVSNAVGSITSTPAVLTIGVPARLANLSARASVGPEDDALIAGFIISGNSPKKILLRAIGPTLDRFALSGVLSDPVLKVRSVNGAVVAANDDWGSAPNLPELVATTLVTGAFPLPAGSRDSVILATLSPGTYTARVESSDGSRGLAMIELYEVDQGVPEKLVNLSARARVGLDTAALVPGIIIAGDSSKRLLIRAVGPGLADFSLPNLLMDPKLELRDVAGHLVAVNDDWGASPDAAAIKSTANASGAFALADGSRDSALLVNLGPGIYTAAVSGAGNSTGIALVEIYELF